MAINTGWHTTSRPFRVAPSKVAKESASFKVVKQYKTQYRHLISTYGYKSLVKVGISGRLHAVSGLLFDFMPSFIFLGYANDSLVYIFAVSVNSW